MDSASGLQAARVCPEGAQPLKPTALPPAPPLPQACPAGLPPASSLRLAHSFWKGLPVKCPAPGPRSPALPEPCGGRGRGDAPSHAGSPSPFRCRCVTLWTAPRKSWTRIGDPGSGLCDPGQAAFPLGASFPHLGNGGANTHTHGRHCCGNRSWVTGRTRRGGQCDRLLQAHPWPLPGWRRSS